MTTLPPTEPKHRADDAGFAVAPLTPARLGDFLAFFDHERGAAFADNPRWAKCYCHFYHVPAGIAWEGFDAKANRTAMTARIAVGEMEGFLAYAGSEVVGWLNAQPLHKLPHCWTRMGVERPAMEIPAHDAAAIVCFVIAPGYRRRGVARALLQGALASLAARGLSRVYAFPFDAGSDNAPTAHYHGPRTLFEAEGFVSVSATVSLTLMCKEFPAAH